MNQIASPLSLARQHLSTSSKLNLAEIRMLRSFINIYNGSGISFSFLRLQHEKFLHDVILVQKMVNFLCVTQLYIAIDTHSYTTYIARSEV